MQTSFHTLRDLFCQLGLPDTRADISRFIAIHRPLARHLSLAEAPFWRPQQAQFLLEEVADDADWAEIVDTLDASLRHPARSSRPCKRTFGQADPALTRAGSDQPPEVWRKVAQALSWFRRFCARLFSACRRLSCASNQVFQGHRACSVANLRQTLGLFGCGVSLLQPLSPAHQTAARLTRHFQHQPALDTKSADSPKPPLRNPLAKWPRCAACRPLHKGQHQACPPRCQWGPTTPAATRCCSRPHCPSKSTMGSNCCA